MDSLHDTIAAIATPLGEGGLGVIRISGRAAIAVTDRLFHSPKKIDLANVPSHTCHFGIIIRPSPPTPLPTQDGSIDQVVVTVFRAPHSYTGEDVVEISAHGSPYILRRIVEDVVASGARIAQPGEFTLRAVAHGKMDLVQAEAVRDFIEAQTERQAKTALSQMDGTLSTRLRPIKEQLVDVIARLEAAIDFAEDDVDVPPNNLVAK